MMMINFPWLFTITIVSTLSIVVRCEPETKLTLDDHMKDTSQHCLELGFQIFDKLGLPDLEKSASSREIISFLFAKYRPEDPYFSVLSNDSLGFLLDYYGTICSDLIIKHQLNHVKPTDHVKESWSNFDIEPSPIEPAKALPKGATVEPEIDDLREIEVADVVDQQLEPNIKLADEEEEPKSDQHEAGAKVDVLSDKDDAIADAEPQPEPNQVAKEIVVENPNASILSRVVNRSAARTTGAISEPASSTGVGIENDKTKEAKARDQNKSDTVEAEKPAGDQNVRTIEQIMGDKLFNGGSFMKVIGMFNQGIPSGMTRKEYMQRFEEKNP